MYRFPNVPLSTYTQPEWSTREDGLIRFKCDLKEWLKVNGLSYAWLAQNLGRKEGTIKNWLYSEKLNISNTQLERMLSLCRAHSAGGQGVIYECRPGTLLVDFIWVRPFLFAEAAAPQKNLADDTEIYYEEWCRAAGVPEDTLYKQKALHYPALAKWVTDTVARAMREGLWGKSVRGLLDADPKRVVTDNLIDIGAVLQGGACPCSFFEGCKFGENGVRVYDESLKKEDICFFLPVFPDEWYGKYVRIAAAASKEKTTDLWIVARLNEAARLSAEREYKAFLDKHFNKED